MNNSNSIVHGSTAICHFQVEAKGRTNTNLQDERHECEMRGVRSKCHVCEDIACGDDLDSTCAVQLQGVSGDAVQLMLASINY